MLEKMSEFFERRLQGYDEHMLTNILGAREFYPYTARQLPDFDVCRILDLGCGTGLELETYLNLCPNAQITGIDLSEKMLDVLRHKFEGKNLNLIVGSYFDVQFGNSIFDAAVSVESLHHFTKQEKIALYSKLHAALKPHGYFILTDYFALSDKDEQMYQKNLQNLKTEQNITDNELYHYDTPLTVKNECDALLQAGFVNISVLNSWGPTHTIKASK